ncbi:polysaccharide deacetylase family protein [Vulcanisaeta thermophila]|uniref:polysaccharide deacetylase family protein n=1 Tax=Vulcanisaeta thermophila TaxID=867917 RepID=UPI0008532B2A|nr:polysaccharide deacetylase family protein [Vulcanisaeta thermophila]
MTYVAISFDDGYIKQYEYAKLLYKMDIPATFFLITGLTEYSGEKLITKEPKLIREIMDMGHEVGSHTHTHPDLTRIGREKIREEFINSINTLRRWGIDYEVGIAYPYGSFNNEVIEEASRYFAYGRTMGEYNRWNERFIRYAIGGMGIRHLPKLIIKLITGKPKLISIVMHRENPTLIKATIEYLKMFNLRFKTLSEAIHG